MNRRREDIETPVGGRMQPLATWRCTVPSQSTMPNPVRNEPGSRPRMRHGPVAATGTRATDAGVAPGEIASGSNRRQELVRCLRIRIDVSHTIERGELPHQVVEPSRFEQRGRKAMHRTPAGAARDAVIAHASKPCFDRLAFVRRGQQVRATFARVDLLLDAERDGAIRQAPSAVIRSTPTGRNR